MKKKTYRITCIIILVAMAFSFGSLAAGHSNTYGALTRGDVFFALYGFEKMGYGTVKLSALRSGPASDFSDIAGKFYEDAVNWAYQNKLTMGTSSGSFSGDSFMTREELSVLLYRYFTVKEIAFGEADLSNYDDAHLIPDWAVKGVALAVNEGFIVPDKNLISSSDLITMSELEKVFLKLLFVNLYPNNTIPRPNAVNYESFIFKSGAGQEIYLGMDIKEISDILELYFEDGFAIVHENISAEIFNNNVVTLTITGGDWTVNDQVGIGSRKEDVVKALGDPLPADEPGYQIPPNGLLYPFDAEGSFNKIKEEFAFILAFVLDQNDVVDAMYLTTTNPFFMPLDGGFICPTFGPILRFVEGSGNASVDVDPKQEFQYEINYYGEGDFVISNSHSELFRRTGPYSGRIILNKLFEDGHLNIEAEGRWTLKTLNITSPVYVGSLSGSGDYVFRNILLPHHIPNIDKLKITHDGEGPFAVKLMTSYPDTDIVIIETVGQFSGLCDIPESNPVFQLQVIADGHWTIELIEAAS